MKLEAETSLDILQEAGRYRVRLLRNNSGALYDKHGRLIRFGLGNESANDNKNSKSSDFIGITPVVITPEMVGHTLGVFTTIEAKKEGWRYTNTPENKAQKRFVDTAKSLGAIGGFATGAADMRQILIDWFNRFKP